MSMHVERPYWVNWLHWHLYYLPFKAKTPQRRAAWDFVERVHRLPKGALVLDCGANIGKVTMAFRRVGARVHAFEPDPHAQTRFRAHFAGDPGVTLHPVGVGAEPGRFTLHRTRDFASNPDRASIASSLFVHDQHGDSDAVEVEVIDLLAFIRGLDRKVDLLKMDIEGAEVAILERMFDEGLHRDIGHVYVETHERFSPDLAARTAALRERIAREKIGNVDLDWH
jgi:FkbM family methyltransferase